MTDLQPPAARPRPHLIHVGYAKSGSSFLRHWFAAHPQIGYRHGRFAGYEQPAEFAEIAADIRLRVTSSENFASPKIAPGDLEPGAYAGAQATICANLAELFPAAHILIVTRGYKSMIMSSYSQYVRSGGAMSLEQLLAEAGEENPWHYDALIGMYRRAFGLDKVMILPWELLRDRPDDFVRQIEDRFGLDHRPPSPQRINRSLSPTELRWYPRIAAWLARTPIRRRLQKRLSPLARRPEVIRMLQRFSPAEAVGAELLPAARIERFRGKASCLTADPLFAPYAADYLNGG